MAKLEAGKFSHPVWLCLAVTFVALVIRIWWLAQVDTQPVTDFAWYLDRAAALARGEGYSVDHVRTAYWPVGYPFFLSLFVRIFGPELWVAKAVNTLLTSAIAAATYGTAWKLGAGKGVATAAGLLAAVSPPLVAYSGIIASEPLYTLLAMLAVLAGLAAASHTKNWAWAGMWAGLATHVRPQAVLVPFILAAATHRFESGKRKTSFWKVLLTVAIAGALTLLPWFVRNLNLYGKPVFVSTNGGDNLWIGSNPEATGRYMTPPGVPAEPLAELENDRQTRQQAVSYITGDFGHWLSLAPAKLNETFLSATDAPYWAFQTKRAELTVPGIGEKRDLFLAFRAVNRVWVLGLLVFAAIGLVAGALSELGRRMLAVAIPQVAYIALVTVVFFGNGRFGLPAQPFLILAGCAALGSIREWTGRTLATDDPLRHPASGP